MRTRWWIFFSLAAFTGCVALVIVGGMAATSLLVLSGNAPWFLPGSATTLNRIAYVGNDENIYIADPVTGKSTPLTTDGGAEHAYNYPAWAPDSRRLAYVGYTLQNGDATEGTLFSVSPTGENLTPLFKTDKNFPFYLYWSPDSLHLSFLTSKDSSNLALWLARADEANSMREIGSGAPYYWVWSPDGSQLFAHIGGARTDSENARLELLSPSSPPAVQALPAAPGAFQAPQWSRDGKLFYSALQESEQFVAAADSVGRDAKRLFNYRGRVSFSVSPDGTRVAYIVTDRSVQLPTLGLLRVVDADGGNMKTITDEPALAFHWAPDSKKIAYLTVTIDNNPSNFDKRFDLTGQALASVRPGTGINSPPNQGGETQLLLHWKVWHSETEQSRTIASFQPTASFLSFLPYFDQYANSATFWSPDSKWFVYTTREGEDKGGVFIADASGKLAPRRIGDGVIAFWSWR